MLTLLATLLACPSLASKPEATLLSLKQGWEKPSRSCKPHTRWWWPGNVLTPSEITWQLEEMATQGMGGVEIMSSWKLYEKGNVEFLSAEYLGLLKHAVAEAKRLDLRLAFFQCLEKRQRNCGAVELPDIGQISGLGELVISVGCANFWIGYIRP